MSVPSTLDVQGPAVLGLPSLEQLKLITLHCTVKKEDAFQTPVATRINATKDLMQMYPDQFDKIGSMPGAVRLSVNKNIHPHIDAPRKTPIALKDYIKQELDNMAKNKVIRKVTEPTDWVSSLAYSHKKDGCLRICLDPRHLYTALRRPHHATPTIKELKHRQDMQKMYHDRTAHDLPPLVPGQDVCILDNQTGKWKPATITSKCAEPRSYILQLPDGSSKRRNWVQIRAAETSSHKQVHFNDHTTSLQKGFTNKNVSHQRSIKQPTCNTTRSGREIHRPKRCKTNKQGI